MVRLYHRTDYTGPLAAVVVEVVVVHSAPYSMVPEAMCGDVWVVALAMVVVGSGSAIKILVVELAVVVAVAMVGAGGC